MRATLLVGAALVVVLAAPQHYRDDLHTANESARVYAAIALVKYRTAALDPVFDEYFPGWRARGRAPNMDVSARDGRYLLDKAPGLTLLALPVVAAVEATGARPGYARLTWVLTLCFAAAPSAAFAALAWRRTGSPVPVLLVLATPWLVYGGLFFSHALAAVLVGVGVVAALGGREREADEGGGAFGGGAFGGGAFGGGAFGGGAFGGGLALGGAVLVEYTSALVVVIVLVALAVDPARRRRLVGVCAGGLGPALVLLAWNWLVFGGPLAMSYAFKANRVLAEVHGHGVYGLALPGGEALWGLSFGARRGLFFVAPWLLVGVAGVLAAAADATLARAWRVALVGGALLVPLGLAGFGDWHGGAAFGPRYLLLALPFLGLGAIELERRAAASAAPARWALAGLVVSSFLVCALGAYVDPYLTEKLVNPIFEVNLPVLLARGPAPSALAALLGLGLVAWALRPLLPRARPLLVTLAVAAAILHILVCTLPTSPSVDAVRAERAQLEWRLAH